MSFLMQRRIQMGYICTVAVSTALLIVVGMIGVRQHFANSEAVNRIDHTGRLRMLGQRVVQKESLIHNGAGSPKVNSQLTAAKAQFEVELQGLKSGDINIELHSETDLDTLATIALVENQWQELIKVSQSPTSTSTKEYDLARLSSVGDKLLQACEQLMVAQRRQLVTGQSILQWIFLSCMVSVLFLGATTLWLLRRRGRLLIAEETVKSTAEILGAMRESEARLKAMMASSLDPLFTVDVRGIVLTASDTVATVFGWNPQKLIGQNIKVLMPEPFRSEHDGYMAEYQRYRISGLLGKSREVLAMRRDGTVFPSLLTVWNVDLPDQSEPIFMGTIRDITELKRNEAELKRFRAALDVSPDADFLVDREQMRFIDMNKTACASLGYSRDELLTMGPQDINSNFSKEELMQLFGEIAESQDGVGVIETQHRRKNGSTFPVEVFLRVLETDGQTIVVASARDLTERKQSEAELASLNRQLVDAARRAGKSEVATSVLHNVGNVLNSVNVSASLIQDKVRESGVFNLTKAVDVMEQHLDDLPAYVTQDDRGKHLPRFLIDVSRQIAGEEEMILEEINSLISNIDHIKAVVATQQADAKSVSGVVDEVSLAELLEDAIHINASSLRRHSITINRQFEDVGPILADKQKILQIMVNLISNAKSACVGGENEDSQITISLRRTGEDYVSLEIRDNGMGIAAENLTKIFAHGFTTRDKGHGFGLHSAALAAKELSGSLTAYSEGPGTGASFTLNLPCQDTKIAHC